MRSLIFSIWHFNIFAVWHLSMIYCTDRLLRVCDLHFNNVLLKTFALIVTWALFVRISFACNFFHYTYRIHTNIKILTGSCRLFSQKLLKQIIKKFLTFEMLKFVLYSKLGERERNLSFLCIISLYSLSFSIFFHI